MVNLLIPIITDDEHTSRIVNDYPYALKLLFDLMDQEFLKFKMPVYFTIGIHERLGITVGSGIDKTNPNN